MSNLVTVTLTEAPRVSVTLQIGSSAPVTILDDRAAVLLAQQRVLVGPPGEPGIDRTDVVFNPSTIAPLPEMFESVAVVDLDQPLDVLDPLAFIGLKQNRRLLISIHAASPQPLTFGGAYVSGTASLPTTTEPGKTLYLGFVYNTFAGKWLLLALAAI